jgi:TonB family protein
MTGEQGRTTLKVTIGADGSASDAQIAKSSGSLRLDEAARDFVKATYRWNPQIKNCKPVEIVTLLDIIWDLRNAEPDPRTLVVAMDAADYPPEALAKQEQGVVLVAVYVSAQNVLLNASVLRSSGFPDLDAKAIEVVKSRYHWIPARLEGKFIPTAIFMSMAWTLPNPAPPPH